LRSRKKASDQSFFRLRKRLTAYLVVRKESLLGVKASTKAFDVANVANVAGNNLLFFFLIFERQSLLFRLYRLYFG
jgi:hypothetical protein